MKQNELSSAEKFKLITECRQSGQTDNQWCMDHNISRSTFYRWIREIRSRSGGIPEQSGLPKPAEKQEVVRIDIVPEAIEENPRRDTGIAMQGGIDRTTIEIVINGVQIRASNAVEPRLLATTLRLLRGDIC